MPNNKRLIILLYTDLFVLTLVNFYLIVALETQMARNLNTVMIKYNNLIFDTKNYVNAKYIDFLNYCNGIHTVSYCHYRSLLTA